MAKVLSREDILTADDGSQKRIEVKKWGGDVYIKSFTVAERAKFETSVMGDDGQPDATMVLGLFERAIVLGVVNEAGESLFTEAHIGALGKKDATTLRAVAQEVLDFNGIGEDKAKKIAKNSEPT